MIQTIVTYISRQQVAAAFGGEAEALEARAVMAGLLAASRELLTPDEFKRLVAECDIDAPTLAELLSLAQADPDQQPPSIEV